MIEQALYEHLCAQEELAPFLACYNKKPAVFSQEAPSDMDEGWACGSQYGRIVFAVDLQGDAERCMGGLLSVDILCKNGEQFPEDIEPVLRKLIHGWFFSAGTFTVAAQWKNSSYFTEPTDQVNGCTVVFDLLGFPVLTTTAPDVIERMNAWCAELKSLHVINHDQLPAPAWRPEGVDSAVYWRLVQDRDAGWVKNRYGSIWRTAVIRGHIFSADHKTADSVAQEITRRLYAQKRLMKEGESPIMVNRNNRIDYGADPLRTGQVSVEGTYGVMVYFVPEQTLEHINYPRE